MTLVSSIITQGFRENNTVPMGASPTTDEQAEALIKLQSIVSAVFGNEVGENLCAWPLGNYGRNSQDRIPYGESQLNHPPINSQLVVTNENSITVYLPANPSDGARIGLMDPLGRLATVPVTLDANGRTIETAATLTLDTASTNRTWFYRGDLGDWQRISDLTTDGTFPFPREFDDYFVTMLAARINPAYERELDAGTIARLKQQRKQLVARYVQSAPLEANTEISFPTLQSYENFAGAWFGGSTDAFNRGWGI